MFLKYLKNSFEEIFVLGLDAGGGEGTQSQDWEGPNLDGTENDFDKGYQITDFFNEEQLGTLSDGEKTRMKELLTQYNQLKKQLDDHELASTIPEQRVNCITRALEKYVIEEDDVNDVERQDIELFLQNNKAEAETYRIIISELTAEITGIKNEIDMAKILNRSSQENSRLKLSRILDLIVYFEDQKANSTDTSRGIKMDYVNKSLRLLYELKYKKENEENSDVSGAHADLLKKDPRLGEMGDYSIDDFTKIPIHDRLKYVTKERKDFSEYGDLSSGDVKLHITFDFGGNYNEELARQLKPLMIFSKDIGKIKVGKTVYTRTSLSGGFFDSTGKPLERLEEGMEITLLKQDTENLTSIPDDIKEIQVKDGDGEPITYKRTDKDRIFKSEDGRVLVLKDGLKISWKGQEELEYNSGTLRRNQELDQYEAYIESEPGRFLEEKLDQILDGVDEIEVKGLLGKIVYKRAEDGRLRVNGEKDGEIFTPGNGGILTYKKGGLEHILDLDERIESIKLGLERGEPMNLVWDFNQHLTKENVEREISQMIRTSGGDLSRFSTESGAIGENFKDDFMKLLKLMFPFAADFINELESSLKGENGGENPYGSFENYGDGNSLGQELANFCKTYSQEWDKNDPMCGRNVYNALAKFGKFPGIHSGDGYMWADQLAKRDDFIEVTGSYTAFNAPPGAIISYERNSGGSKARQDNGHVEIALGGGQYYFGITSSHPGGSNPNPSPGTYRIFLPKSPMSSFDTTGYSSAEFSGENNKGNVIGLVYNGLLSKEGASGDSTGAAATGKLGLTTATYASMKKKHGANISEEDAIKYYLSELYDTWSSKGGFNNASLRLKVALVDSAYNLGGGVVNYVGLGRALSTFAGTDEEYKVLFELLNTANIGGAGSKGVARRRAAVFNLVAPPDKIITTVTIRGGSIIYSGRGGNVIFSYEPKNGIHSSSSQGSIKV